MSPPPKVEKQAARIGALIGAAPIAGLGLLSVALGFAFHLASLVATTVTCGIVGALIGLAIARLRRVPRTEAEGNAARLGAMIGGGLAAVPGLFFFWLGFAFSFTGPLNAGYPLGEAATLLFMLVVVPMAICATGGGAIGLSVVRARLSAGRPRPLRKP